MFNVHRLELARKRRRLTAKMLADAAGVGPVTLSRIVNQKQAPDPETVAKLVRALGFPASFFEKDLADHIDASAASFRSMTSMTARERDAALAAGSIAYEVADWVAARYQLPDVDLIDLSSEWNPAAAARLLRSHWGIGEKPIGHFIKLLEAKGLRVFSLSENTRTVDAFSVWRGKEAFIFLNTYKTAERSRFDAAHELGHLILHKHGGPQQDAEKEANAFAASFLMPEADVRSRVPHVQSLDQIIVAKKRWGVSAAALAYRLHKLAIISDWQHRSFCIQLNSRFGKSEPAGIEAERSAIWQMVLQDLWKDGVTRATIARDLDLPPEEFDDLLFGLTGDPAPPARAVGRPAFRAV